MESTQIKTLLNKWTIPTVFSNVGFLSLLFGVALAVVLSFTLVPPSRVFAQPLGSNCETDTDCDGSLICKGNVCSAPVGVGDACARNAECISNNCDSTYGACVPAGVSTSGGATGTEGTVCAQNPSICNSGLTCDATYKVCVPVSSLTTAPGSVADGGYCAKPADCAHGTCKDGSCALLNTGDVCANTDDCAKGYCNADGQCALVAVDGVCAITADCASGLTCDSNGQCETAATAASTGSGTGSGSGSGSGTTSGSGSTTTPSVQGGLIVCGGGDAELNAAKSVSGARTTAAVTAALTNFQKNSCQLIDVFKEAAKLTNYLIGMAGVVAVILMIIAGFKLVVMSNNETEMAEAQKSLTNAIIGFCIILLAFVIINTLFSIFAVKIGASGTFPYNPFT